MANKVKRKEKKAVEELIKEIKREFSKFKKEMLALILYGSFACGLETIKSDIDICVIAGSKEKAKELYKKTLEISAKKPNYDIHFFELMPLHAQIEVIESGKIIYVKSISELNYYFYFYRKLWQDQAIHRIKIVT
ncbi:MAG: nucleotidyltransferase domain-containing protein [Candidatus Pacearchaeota archaeon]